jgi:hypothetical protein
MATSPNTILQSVDLCILLVHLLTSILELQIFCKDATIFFLLERHSPFSINRPDSRLAGSCSPYHITKNKSNNQLGKLHRRGSSNLKWGQIQVPVDYNKPQGDKVNLTFARIKSNSASRIRSLFYNPGGSGGGAATDAVSPQVFRNITVEPCTAGTIQPDRT